MNIIAQELYQAYKKGYEDGQKDLKEILIETIESRKDSDPRELIAGICFICKE